MCLECDITHHKLFFSVGLKHITSWHRATEREKDNYTQLLVVNLLHRRWKKPALKQTERPLASGHFLSWLHAGSDGSEGSKSPKFGLPRVYDKSYRISFSVVTPDLAYRLRRVNERREDEGKEGQWGCVHVWLSCNCDVIHYLCNFSMSLNCSLVPRLLPWEPGYEAAKLFLQTSCAVIE